MGAKVIDNLSHDIKSAFPELDGFSTKNIKLMVQFYREYESIEIGQLPVAQMEDEIMPPIVAQIPFGISEYELTEVLPKEFESSLPTIEMIENELKNSLDE